MKRRTKQAYSNTNDQQILEHIRKRANELWEAHGWPQGCDQQHWLEADREIRSQTRPSARAR